MSKILTVPINNNVIFAPAIDGIANQFNEFKHYPSKEYWSGLEEIVKAIEGMAVRAHESDEYPAFKEQFYISSLAPGMGKTTALIQTVKAIINTKPHMIDGVVCDYSHISFIIFLSRLSEISSMVDKMGLNEDDYSVIVSPNEEVFNKGNQDKKSARVLFTTQQMLERRCHEGNALRKFSEIKDFYYNDKPRQVRIWDEAIMPSRILTMDADVLGALPKELFSLNFNLAHEIRQFHALLVTSKDGDLIDTPDLSPYEELLGDNETLQGLHSISGSAVRVVMDNRNKTTALQYADILPEDLAPMLILDASGEQRITYEWWKESRKNLEFLHSPPKLYSGLTVHHWDRGSGRNTILKKNNKKDYVDLVQGISETCQQIGSDKKILIVHLKPDKNHVDLEQEIKTYLGAGYNPDNIKFLTWGRHTATNEFKDFKHIILSSLWYYSPAGYEGHVISSKKQDFRIPATKEEMKAVQEREHRHHVLQAACRGKVRYAVGNKCPDGCHLYIIYSRKQGLPGMELMQAIFPDSVYETWNPLWKLMGKAAEIRDTISSHKGPISMRGLMQKHGVQKGRLMDYINKDIYPWYNKHGMILDYDPELELFTIFESIEKPF